MKISLVSIEKGITAIGFRKIASIARNMNSDTEICYIAPMNLLSPFSVLISLKIKAHSFLEKNLQTIAAHFADKDMVCFSSMTEHSEITKEIIRAIKKLNPSVYIVWGGIHPIVDPEDAIKAADAICTGEGETAFRQFFDLYKSGADYSTQKNFWFNQEGRIIRNGFLPLHTNEEMGHFPLPLYADNELIYKENIGFVPLDDYIPFHALAYNTVWSIGCPFKCAYCSNSKFSANDKYYGKLRHSPVDYVINEIKYVISRHPHISTILFHDDSFMAIPMSTLEEFTTKWKKEINLSFCVYGVIPNYVKKEKIHILIWAGMNRMRMGIQSGSQRILDFYKRPSNVASIKKSVSVIASFSGYMIPPAYDIILDNPIETKQDVIDTLNLLYNMPRFYTINVFALRGIPNTELAREFAERNVVIQDIGEGYNSPRPTIANIMVYMLAVFTPPKIIYDYLLKYVKPFSEEQKLYPVFMFTARFVWLVKRAFDHLRFMDFSILPSKWGWILWKLGILQAWQKHMVKKIPMPVQKGSLEHNR